MVGKLRLISFIGLFFCLILSQHTTNSQGYSKEILDLKADIKDLQDQIARLKNTRVFRLAASAEVFWRQVKLYINDYDKMAYAEISNGDPTDEIWIDRSFDGGNNFEGSLGRAAIPSGYRSVRTSYFSLQSDGREGVLRAGGKAGNRVEIALTSWEGAH